jgi:membrane-associated protein
VNLDLASAYGLGLVVLILIKEIGVPVPVPGDLLIIGAGAATARGDAPPIVLLAALIGASVVGGAIQFGLLRSVASGTVLRLLSRVAGEERIAAQATRLRNAGARGVALVRMTPGVRIPSIPACAVAAVPVPAFIAGLAVGNGVFIAAHFGLGFVAGEAVVSTVSEFLGPIAIAIVVLAIIGAVGWAVLMRRRRQDDERHLLETEGRWADACCPVCLGAAAATR